MFAQIVRAHTARPAAVRQLLDRWLSDVEPGATGWLGSVFGVTDDGNAFACVRFDCEGSARRNAARPEQSRWWADFETLLDGPAVFQDSTDVDVEQVGDLDRAAFVQVIIGQSGDFDRSRELMRQPGARRIGRSGLLGTVSVGHEDGRYTVVLYCTSEAQVGQTEKATATTDVDQLMHDLRVLQLVRPEYLDLRDPWLCAP